MKQNRAITLIALVITIILLIILASVSISMIVGENGIIQKAREAKQKVRVTSIAEQIALEILNIEQEKEWQNETITRAQLTDELDKRMEHLEKLDTNILRYEEIYYRIDAQKQVIPIEPVMVTDKKQAMVFDADSYIQTNLKESDFIAEDADFTIAAKVKINRKGQQMVPYMDILGNHLETEGFIFQFWEDSQELRLSPGIRIDYSPYYDQWTDLVYVYHQGKIQIFVNGNLVREEEGVVTPYGDFLIGNGYLQDTKRQLRGMIGSIKIWKTALTQMQVERLVMLEEKTSIQPEMLLLESILSDKESVEKIGSIQGNSRFENWNYALKYALQLNGSTDIHTNWKEEDVITQEGAYTIAVRVKINRQAQETVSYMDIVGNHISGSGFVMQFDKTTTSVGIGGIGVVYTPYYDKWVDLIFTYHKGNTQVYINKSIVGEEKTEQIPYNNFLIGNAYIPTDRAMKGSIASIKIWNIDISKEEVENLDMLEEHTPIQSTYIYKELLLDNQQNMEKEGNFVGENYQYKLQ